MNIPPKVSSTTYVYKKIKSFKELLLRRVWVTMLIGILAVSPFLGSGWNMSEKRASAAADLVHSWAQSFGGTTSDTGKAIVVDSDGNVYGTGNYTGTVDFDPGVGTANFTSLGSNDVYVTKFDSSGNFIWAKSFGGTGLEFGYDIAIDSDDNIYTTGYFTNTVDFDPGVGTFNITDLGSGEGYISKLDTDGNFIWAKSFAATSNTWGKAIVLDSTGNIYITGDFNGTPDFDPGVGTYNLTTVGNSDTFVSKLDSNGDFVWAKSWGSIGNESTGEIAVDSSGNVYTSGSYRFTVDFDPGAGTSNSTVLGNSDAFVSKLDSSGNFVWVKTINGTSTEAAFAMTVDPDSNVYTTGYYGAISDFDSGVGTINMTPVGSYDAFVQKLDTDGNLIWAKSLGGTGFEEPLGITLDSDNNVYTTGDYGNTGDFDPGAGTYNLTSAGSNDVFISKLDSSGNFVLAKSIGGTGYDYAYSLVVDSDTNLYTIGNIVGTVDLDPGAGIDSHVSVGSQDIFISKLSLVLPPTITDSPATVVTRDSATLTGNITALGGESATSRGFQYGTTNSYGTTVTQSSGPYLTGEFTADLTGLVCRTTYYFRAYATNSGGTTYSTGSSFDTTSCASTGGSGGGGGTSGTTPTPTDNNSPTPTSSGNPSCPYFLNSDTCMPGDGTNPTPTSTNSSTPGTPSSPSNPSSPTNSSNPTNPRSSVGASLMAPAIKFYRNLGFGSVGEDVKRLQQFLNVNEYTLSPTGAGSSGSETTYYGSRTRQAVKVFQETFASTILNPIGLTSGTGFFGNATRAFVNSLLQ